jgi:hypothetical protein
VSEDTGFNVPQDLFHFKAVIFSEVKMSCMVAALLYFANNVKMDF